jgi:hypothetical protein
MNENEFGLPIAASDDVDTLAFKIGIEKVEVIRLAVILGLEQMYGLLNYKSAQSWTGNDFCAHLQEAFAVRKVSEADYNENRG